MDTRGRPGVPGEEPEEIKWLKAENRRLRERGSKVDAQTYRAWRSARPATFVVVVATAAGRPPRRRRHRSSNRPGKLVSTRSCCGSERLVVDRRRRSTLWRRQILSFPTLLERSRVLPVLPMARIVSAIFRYSTVRYLVVGGCSLLLDLGLLTLSYRVFGLPLEGATAIGFWGSFAFNFTLQKKFSFADASPTGRSLWRYCALLAVNSVVNIAVVALFEKLGWGFALGKIVVTGAQTVWNYFVYRYWVFATSARTSEVSAPGPAGDARPVSGS